MLLLVGLVLTASGCDSGGDSDDDDTPGASIGGAYVGVFDDGHDRIEYTYTIPETESGNFSFDVREEQDGDVETYTGTGTYGHPGISFTVNPPSPTEPYSLNGTVSDDRDVLTLTDGFVTITYRRD